MAKKGSKIVYRNVYKDFNFILNWIMVLKMI